MEQAALRRAREGDAAPKPTTLDEPVLERLSRLNIPPALPCSDAVFVRRVYLDAIGTLPTEQEARRFLSELGPDKRARLVEELLGREEFADYWAMKWCDVLRVKSEFPINLWPLAAQRYHRWIRTCIKQGVPFDRFVRELLTASGSNFRDPRVNFYRAAPNRQPETIAKEVALTFMGARADKWPQRRLAGMAAFFSQLAFKSTGEWKEEIVFHDASKPAPTQAAFPDGTPAKFMPGEDPRGRFTDWLVGPKNPWFARSVANRVWNWLFGRGIVEDVDDMRPDNPPRNPALLAYLEKEFVAAHFDLRSLFRLILNSSTYQQSSIPRAKRPDPAADFACYPLRRLEAEVLIDAINQITGTTESYSSATPEPYTYVPEDRRSIQLPDGSITSSFLEMFGRPSRDTGYESERNNKPTTDQRLHMLNSSHIQRKMERGPGLATMLKPGKTGMAYLDDLYLTILSRYPTKEERIVAAQYAKAQTNRRNAAVDLAWALLNSSEFLYKH